MSNFLASFDEDLNVVVIGATGGIGFALIEHLFANSKVKSVYALSRRELPIGNSMVQHVSVDLEDETSIEAAANKVSARQPIDIVIVATGLLHTESGISPEKSLRELDIDQSLKVLSINTVGPALVMKHFLPKMTRERKSVFSAISARVGSISDNELGGWYSYRASKAALNMMLKTASIEMARTRKQMTVIGLHPGTVDTSLSEPFSANVAEGKLFTPEYSAECLLKVINDVTPAKTGQIFAWDGKKIEY